MSEEQRMQLLNDIYGSARSARYRLELWLECLLPLADALILKLSRYDEEAQLRILVCTSQVRADTSSRQRDTYSNAMKRVARLRSR